jgi:hypothetical protein
MIKKGEKRGKGEEEEKGRKKKRKKRPLAKPFPKNHLSVCRWCYEPASTGVCKTGE